MYKTNFIIVTCIILVLGSVSLSLSDGVHKGEQNAIKVEILFSGQVGTTLTNSNGIYYYYGKSLIGTEPKIYPAKYWGTYPMYFFGMRTGVKVRIKNIGPRAKAKIRIKTEAYVLRTNGSNGIALMTPKTIDVEVKKGETKEIDASFVCNYSPGAESGLDRFLVKVLHINEGKGSGKNEPSLIMVREGVFCPPEMRK